MAPLTRRQRQHSTSAQMQALMSHVEAVDNAVLNILTMLCDDPTALSYAGAINRAWRSACAAADGVLWRKLCERDMLLVLQLMAQCPSRTYRQLYAQQQLKRRSVADLFRIARPSPQRSGYLLGTTLRKLGKRMTKTVATTLDPADQAEYRELGEVIFTSLAELSTSKQTLYDGEFVNIVTKDAGGTICSLRSGAGGDEGSDICFGDGFGGVEPAGICWYQFAVDFFLLRKSDSKQFALCAGTSERIDGVGDYSGENDGLARRPEDAENNEGGQETYRWLVPSTGSAFGNTAVRLKATITWVSRQGRQFPLERPQFSRDDEDEQSQWERDHGWEEAEVTRIELDLMDEDTSYDGSYVPERRLTQVDQALQLMEHPMLTHRWV